ncbi:dihydrodipicolinate synthase family protein [Neorhizobium tomejilense]|uniref:dihydrodipicolinate synthase family protein n=1 Tax=Neorhizobium tomejilense TaxID=2093828 RepID=UPI003ECE551C
MPNFSVTPEMLAKSVLSVPPLARKADYTLDREGNRQILAHLAQGGVTTALYGGNANLYNISVREFAEMVDMLKEIAPSGTWLIPSVGPDYGKSLDQIAILKDHDLPTAMVLPLNFPVTSAGVATGLRRIADAYGRPIIAYVKSLDYISAADLAAVVADGAICTIKYAVVRQNPKEDAYLSELVQKVDRKIIISGIGERPAISHLMDFGLQGFTSGSVCVAPAMSTGILKALKAGNVAEAERLRAFFMGLEDLRDGISPLRVLHEAVATAGIADTGPMLPFLENITDAKVLSAITEASQKLLAADRAYQSGQVEKQVERA